MLKLQTILVPIDFSETSQDALDVARSLARDHHARLVVMSSQPIQQVTETYVPALDESQVIEDLRRRLEQLAGSITDLPVETRWNVGGPGPAIVATATEVNADMIVMGTQGRTGLVRMLLGSVAEYVLRHAPCPVLTIKPQTAEHMRHELETGLTASRA